MDCTSVQVTVSCAGDIQGLEQKTFIVWLDPGQTEWDFTLNDLPGCVACGRLVAIEAWGGTGGRRPSGIDRGEPPILLPHCGTSRTSSIGCGRCPTVTVTPTVGGCDQDRLRVVLFAVSIDATSNVESRLDFGDGNSSPWHTESAYAEEHHYDPHLAVVSPTLSFSEPEECQDFQTPSVTLEPCPQGMPMCPGIPEVTGYAGAGTDACTVYWFAPTSPSNYEGTWTWTFDDGETDVTNQGMTRHRYGGPGHHSVTVVFVPDEPGCPAYHNGSSIELDACVPRPPGEDSTCIVERIAMITALAVAIRSRPGAWCLTTTTSTSC
jgi:hypothetical protein